MFLILDLVMVTEKDRPHGSHLSQSGVPGGQQGRSLGHPSGKDSNIALRVKGRQGQIDQNSSQGRDKTGLS